jgi:hypothetical protein
MALTRARWRPLLVAVVILAPLAVVEGQQQRIVAAAWVQCGGASGCGENAPCADAAWQTVRGGGGGRGCGGEGARRWVASLMARWRSRLTLLQQAPAGHHMDMRATDAAAAAADDDADALLACSAGILPAGLQLRTPGPILPPVPARSQRCVRVQMRGVAGA